MSEILLNFPDEKTGFKLYSRFYDPLPQSYPQNTCPCSLYLCVCSGLDHVRSHQIPCLPCWCTPAVSIPMLIPIQRVNTVQPPESLFFTYSTNVLFLTESNVSAHKRKQSAGIGLVCLKTGYCQTVSTPKSTRYHVPYQMAVGLQLYFQPHPNITLLVSVGPLLVTYFLPIPAS